MNKLRGTLKVCAIKAPGFGDNRKALLEDIAALLGATVVSEEKGMQLKDAGTEVLGQAEKITITKEKTIIVNAVGDQKNIKIRISQIDLELAHASNEYDTKRLKREES